MRRFSRNVVASLDAPGFSENLGSDRFSKPTAILEVGSSIDARGDPADWMAAAEYDQLGTEELRPVLWSEAGETARQGWPLMLLNHTSPL